MVEKSSAFFVGERFDIMGSVCTDFKGVEAVKKWKSVLAPLSECRGFMYTTWSSDYGKLEQIGEVLGAPVKER